MIDQALPFILAVLAWAAPQPQYSQGLLVVYGGQQLIEANAHWHGYDLADVPSRCGFAAISPAMLGRLAWFRTEYSGWVGPCVSVDAVARTHAYGSIFERHEVAEVSRDVAAMLGFEYGAPGYVFFGSCPPPADSVFYTAQPYAPELTFDHGERDWTPSFYPYPPMQAPVACDL